MGRLIDADALWESAETCRETTSAFQALIESAPTVDAVPVKWIQSYVKRLEDNGNTFAAAQYEMMIDDYRADGERRSE